MKAIVALNKEGIIGIEGKLPWHIPDDLARFKEKTTGSTIVMGRKTYEEILLLNKCKPLTNRENFVLSTTLKEVAPGFMLARNNSDFHYRRNIYGNYWAIGGAEVYRNFLPSINEIHMTVVDYMLPAKNPSYFPFLNPLEWGIISAEPKRVKASCKWDRLTEVDIVYLVLKRIFPKVEAARV